MVTTVLNENLASAKQGFEVSFDATHKIMHVVFFGCVYFKDIIDGFSTVIRHQEFELNMPACYDFSNATLEMNMNSTEIIFHFTSGLAEKRGKEYLLALVYNDEMTKALFDFYRLYLARTQIDVEMFKNSQTAIDWIIESQKEKTISYL